MKKDKTVAGVEREREREILLINNKAKKLALLNVFKQVINKIMLNNLFFVC